MAYNKCFNRARVVIENIFGRIKNKFRVLKDGLRFRDMEKCAKLVLVCFAIYNFLLDHEGHEEDTDYLDGPTEADEPDERPMATNKKLTQKYFENDT
jgi:hypothetical protein